MKKISKLILTLVLIVAALAGLIYQGSFADRAEAATSNPSTGSSGYQVIALPISAITTTTSGIVKFKAPWPMRIVHMSAVGNAVTGTCTLDLVNSVGTSLLSSAMTLSTSVGDATLTATTANLNITDETNISLNTANTGTANNVTVLLGIKRL
jgi:hypothetical protein